MDRLATGAWIQKYGSDAEMHFIEGYMLIQDSVLHTRSGSLWDSPNPFAGV